MDKYDLESRLLAFNKSLFRELRSVSKNGLNDILITQLARSSTSVGANYIEANNSISYKEFRHKIFLCKKEINESKYWFELLLDSEIANDNLKSLYNELEELRLIFNKIANKVRNS